MPCLHRWLPLPVPPCLTSGSNPPPFHEKRGGEESGQHAVFKKELFETSSWISHASQVREPWAQAGPWRCALPITGCSCASR